MAKNSRALFNKRKGCVVKKTEELSVLCGVQACIVMYGPDNPEPDVWPPREETMEILTHFNNLPEAVRNKNMMNQKDFVSKQMEKLRVELRKVEEENSRLEAMVLLHKVLDGQSTIADVAGSRTEALLTLSGAVEAHLDEVRNRMDEMCSVPQPVGPLEEVLLQGQCSFRVSGADAVPQGQQKYFSGFDCSDMAPPRKKQRVFGLDNADVASGLGEQFCLPNWCPLAGNRERGCGPESSDVAPPGRKQCDFGLRNGDLAPCQGGQLCLPDCHPVVDSREREFGPKSADVAPPGKNQGMSGPVNTDIAPQMGEQFDLPDWCPSGSSREGGYVSDSADMAAVPWSPGTEDEIDQFFDWCLAGGSREGGHVPESADMAAVPWSPDTEDETDQFFDWSYSGIQELLSA